MDFNSNPIIKNSLRKAAFLVSVVLILEIGIIFLLSYFFGFSYVFWITILISAIGYGIRPSKNISSQRLSEPFSPRRMASTLLIIPGFLTDIAAILILIGPIRRFMFAKIIQRILPNISRSLNPFGTAGLGGNPFGGLDLNQLGQMGMGDMNFGQQNTTPFDPTKKRTRKKRHQPQEDIIDIEVENSSQNDDIHAEVIRTKQEKPTPKALPSDVIDV